MVHERKKAAVQFFPYSDACAILLNRHPKPKAYWSGRSLGKCEELILKTGASVAWI